MRLASSAAGADTPGVGTSVGLSEGPAEGARVSSSKTESGLGIGGSPGDAMRVFQRGPRAIGPTIVEEDHQGFGNKSVRPMRVRSHRNRGIYPMASPLNLPGGDADQKQAARAL
jgi:hypothetical protein